VATPMLSKKLAFPFRKTVPMIQKDFKNQCIVVSYRGMAIVHKRLIIWMIGGRAGFEPAESTGYGGILLCEFAVEASGMLRIATTDRHQNIKSTIWVDCLKQDVRRLSPSTAGDLGLFQSRTPRASNLRPAD
jgi:hypothetical protein